MNVNAESLLAWLTQGGWVIVAVGVVVCGLAWYFGRRMASGQRADLSETAAAFEATFLQGISKDRRAAPRRKGNTVEVELNDGRSRLLITGWVLDRSIGGLGILVDKPIPEGTVLKVRPRQSAEATPWTDVTVRFCREDGGQYELGCQFHRTPNWSLLLQFG